MCRPGWAALQPMQLLAHCDYLPRSSVTPRSASLARASSSTTWPVATSGTGWRLVHLAAGPVSSRALGIEN